MLQWYNHSIDVTTISIHYTSVLASILTYLLTATYNKLEYTTKSNPQATHINHFNLLIGYIFGSLRF